ncbi:MAG: Fe-S cluster assembly protein SufD [Flammeovirgaceae bacterium]|jgi:Fe-S cluster assembly protein SufD|nr:Fe-S cluster assembly protein SufD [Flammeovirgaceae bacterium]
MNTTEARDLKHEIIESFDLSRFEVGNDQRAKAMAHFKKVGLPDIKHEEYRFTPITKNLEKNFKWDIQVSTSQIASIDSYLIPNLDANVLVFVNGSYVPSLSKVISPASEVKILPLIQANAEKEISNLDKYLTPESDPFAAMNAAYWQDGLFIHVPENINVSKPIFILHLNDVTKSQALVHTRILGIVEKGSQLSVIEKFDSVGSNPAFHNFSEEWIVKEQSQLEYCKIQNDSGKSYQVANTVIHQSDSSQINTFTLTLNGQLIRNNLSIIIDGENCESHFYGLYLLNGNTLGDNHTVVDHKKPNSFSNEMYKGIMDGNSKGIFNGKIFVRPHAQKTNAFQSNRNILVSDSATVNTKPQLEIWADDVKCSHGCTTGQLDEEALFYLRSRGISEPIAKAMLLYAFAGEVLTPIKNETLKSYLDKLISERLHKNFE